MSYNLCSWFNLLSATAYNSDSYSFSFSPETWRYYVWSCWEGGKRSLGIWAKGLLQEEHQPWNGLARCSRASFMGDDDMTYQLYRLLRHDLALLRTFTSSRANGQPKALNANLWIMCFWLHCTEKQIDSGRWVYFPRHCHWYMTQSGSKLGPEFDYSHVSTMGSRNVPPYWWIWKEQVDHKWVLFSLTVLLKVGLSRN